MKLGLQRELPVAAQAWRATGREPQRVRGREHADPGVERRVAVPRRETRTETDAEAGLVEDARHAGKREHAFNLARKDEPPLVGKIARAAMTEGIGRAEQLRSRRIPQGEGKLALEFLDAGLPPIAHARAK